ncbi:MAG: hypothetical protein NTU41_00845 [Chloroflexi bacterium]|nr:hypothetical protein [Chloroflexota bacterium]
MNEAVFDFRRSQSKPLVVVLPAGSTEPKRIETEGRLVAARIPVYPTMERAAKAISNVSRYYNFRAGAAQRPDHL